MKKIPRSDDYDIRYSLAGDEKHLLQWLNWPAMSANFTCETDREKALFVRNWASFFPHHSALTSTYKNAVVAMATLFLMPYVKVSKHALLYFIVDPHLQRKGIGTSLIKNILHLARTKFLLERVYLDVYDGSSAKPFLEHCGFSEVLRQEKCLKLQDGTYRGRTLMEVRLS